MLIDRFSPVVVKEIRQGLKSRVFSSSFLILQALMVFCILMYLISLRQRSDVSFVDGMFWFFLGLPLILIMPVRAFQTIHEEHKNQTLELVFLTRLSAWQISFGKWMALYAQCVLILVAVLPYLVLRYFLGGINVLDDLMAVGFLMLASALLVGLGVGLSAVKMRLIRILLMVFAVLSIYMVPMIIIAASMGGSGMRTVFTNPWAIWIMILASLILLVYMLEFGASLIAPPAENHAIRKRILAALVMICLLISPMLGANSSVYYYALFFLIPVGIDAITEQPRFIASLYRPPKYGGWFTRRIMAFFYPGWPSGLAFLLVLWAMVMVFAATFWTGSSDFITRLWLLIAAMIFPLALIQLVRPKQVNLLTPYLVMQVAFFIVTVILYAMAEATIMFDMSWLALIPTSAFFMTLFDDNLVMDGYPLTALMGVLSLLVLFLRMRAPLAATRALEKRFLKPAPPAPAPTEAIVQKED